MEDYGLWCTEWFISTCVKSYLEQWKEKEREIVFKSLSPLNLTIQSEVASSNASPHFQNQYDLTNAEKRYVASVLRQVIIVDDMSIMDISLCGMITPKCQVLIQCVLEEVENEDCRTDFSGLVFVQQRVAVAALSKVLETHPQTRDQFSTVTLCGSSKFGGRVKASAISDLVIPTNEHSVLEELKIGKYNLLICTNVAEEGIDIQACGVVICFSLPQNLKSFIQRRGRARKESSRCILMLGDENMKENQRVGSWEDLEAEMKRVYEDDLRHLKEDSDGSEEDESEGAVRMFHTKTKT